MVKNIGLATLVSRVGIERRNAVGKDRCVSIARTLRSHAYTQTGNEIESESQRPPDHVYKYVALTCGREFGNMAGKLEEYEKLLRDLSLRVDEPDQIMILKALEKVCVYLSLSML